MGNDFRYALRMLAKTPGFTALTVFVLAAGLGVAIYMFLLIRTLAFAGMPFPDSDRIVVADIVENGFEQNGGNVRWYDFQQFAAQQTSFETFYPNQSSSVIMSGRGLPERLQGSYTSSTEFDLTQVQALLGRRLLSDDAKADAPNVAVLSYDLWQRDFAGDKNVIGQTLKFDDKITTIIGVMPKDYGFPQNSELWLQWRDPGVKQPGEDPTVLIVGKLKAGVSVATANNELQALAKRIEEQYPSTNSNRGIKVWPLTQITMSNAMPVVALMIGAAAFILILVILNAGNLLLVRAVSRQKEMAIRSALGAGRITLVRGFLVEALLLAFMGGVLGLFAASWACVWTQEQFSFFSDALPFWWHFNLNAPVMIFAFLLCLSTAFAIGLYPAWRTSCGDLNSFLRDGTRGAQGVKVMRMTNVMVIVEIILAIALLIASGVLVRSVQHSLHAEYGARTDHVLSSRMYLYKEQYKTPAAQAQFYDKLLLETASIPGNKGLTLGAALPGQYSEQKSLLIEGMDLPDRHYPKTVYVPVADNYFDLFNMHLLSGRGFDSREQMGSMKVAVVSEQFAQRYWPHQEAIGKRFKLDPENENSEWLTVNGVVNNVLHGQPVGDYLTENVYVSLRQFPMQWIAIAMRTEGSALGYTTTLAQHVALLDADLPIYRVQELDDFLVKNLSGMAFVGKLFISLAILAVLLAGSGIYAVISRSVQMRTQELGVRRALGASDTSIIQLLAKQGLWRLAIGGSIGLALGLLLTQAASSLMYDVGTTTSFVAVLVVATVSLIVMMATLIPARQSVKLTPSSALRYE